jgi:hypothetical protein
MIRKSRVFNKISLSVVILAAVANLSMFRGDDYSILSEADLEQQEVESKTRPALSAALTAEFYWQSFNKWLCFPSREAEFACSETDFGKSLLPTIRIAGSQGTRFDFDIDPEPDLDCEETLNVWRELIANQQSFCVYAAYLQDLDDNHELWVIETVKSNRGVWTVRATEDESADQPKVDEI